MRTTLDIPDEMFRRLKTEAALRGAKLKDLLALFIEKGLAEPKPVEEHRPRSPLPMLRPRTGAVHASLSNAELEDLLTDNDSHARP